MVPGRDFRCNGVWWILKRQTHDIGRKTRTISCTLLYKNRATNSTHKELEQTGNNTNPHPSNPTPGPAKAKTIPLGLQMDPCSVAEPAAAAAEAEVDYSVSEHPS